MKPVLIMLALFILSVLVSKILKKIDKKRRDKIEKEYTEKQEEFFKGKRMKKDVQEWYNEAMNRNN